MSLALGLFVIFASYVVGGGTKLFVGVDFGILMFWGNQIFLLVLFCTEKPAGDSKLRVHALTTFDQGTLVCQILPLLWAFRKDAFSYYTFSIVVILQALFKLVLMLTYNKIVDLSL